MKLPKIPGIECQGLQMKKKSTPLILHSSHNEPVPRFKHDLSSSDTNKKNRKTLPSVNYIKAAVKKISGVFSIFLLRKRNASSRDAINGGNRSSSQVKEASFTSDHSTGSKYKSSPKFRYSDSYNSSNSISEQLGQVSFSIEEIIKATENFSPANKIGEGGFGTVYKGIFSDGSLVAVKRAKKDKRSQEEFKNEILALSKIEHLNLVKLYGYLEHGDEWIVLIEYVNNGNLREHLDGRQGDGLEFSKRLDIAIDVAHAITYLHMYADPPIIHRDIKASNILITEKLRAKVADFGFARLAAEYPGTSHISTQIKGTTGYLDPEYLRTYQLSEKSDVYSFGVLLVELVTGRQPIELKKPLKERVTARWHVDMALQYLREGNAIFVTDPKLKKSPASFMAMEKMLKLAQQCVAPSRQSRPSMKKCAEVLWGIRKEFREIAFSSSSPSPSPSTSHHSANFPNRDANNRRHKMFGVQEDGTHKFMSA